MSYFIRAEEECEDNSVFSLNQGDEDDVDIIFEEGRKVPTHVSGMRIRFWPKNRILGSVPLTKRDF